ncbi:MAG: hypothetical protein RBU30_13150 [Polyangia bacterium]|jgi:DMSO reductase anchor subunit|nr:hypothetical protein [Polyangia bacterium]
MNWIRSKLSSLGLLLLALGVISSLLQLVGYELRALRALNEAGPAVAWGVRIGLIVAGVLLFLLAPKEPPEEQEKAG